jgi:hypothetical protein
VRDRTRSTFFSCCTVEIFADEDPATLRLARNRYFAATRRRSSYLGQLWLPAVPAKEEALNIDDTLTWRDIADHLTAKQRAMLDEWDTRPSHPDGDEGHRRGLIVVARQMAADNIAQETFARMPKPLGATTVDTWRADGDRPCVRRFTGPRRGLVAVGGKAVTVDVLGAQYSDGEIERTISVSAESVDLGSARVARELADSLNAAADDLDRLNELDGQTSSSASCPWESWPNSAGRRS